MHRSLPALGSRRGRAFYVAGAFAPHAPSEHGPHRRVFLCPGHRSVVSEIRVSPSSPSGASTCAPPAGDQPCIGGEVVPQSSGATRDELRPNTPTARRVPLHVRSSTDRAVSLRRAAPEHSFDGCDSGPWNITDASLLERRLPASRQSRYGAPKYRARSYPTESERTLFRRSTRSSWRADVI
jgi:hypothetical protein